MVREKDTYGDEEEALSQWVTSVEKEYCNIVGFWCCIFRRGRHKIAIYCSKGKLLYYTKI